MSTGLFDDILEPRKKYLQELEKTHLENVTSYFDDLVNQAKVDAASNKETCNKIYSLESQIKALQKRETMGKGLFALAIVGFFLLLFGGLIAVVIGSSEPKKPGVIAVGIIVVCLGIALMVFSVIRRRNTSKKIAALIKNKTEELEMLKRKAYGQMAALNNLYEWNIYNILMQKTTPLIEMDRIFDMEKYNQLKDKFKWDEKNDVHRSTVLAQSGSILGNPFIIYREHVQSMGSQTYTGSITITWMERVSDGKGGSHMRSRSQTLTASVTKPKPVYNFTTRFKY